MQRKRRPAGSSEAGREAKPASAQAAATPEAPPPTQSRQADAGATPSPADVAFCPNCFYDLRGTAGDACPECGEALDLNQLRRGLIPWTQRHEIGRLRGFVRTAWRATSRPRQLCYAVAQPVSYRDARWFQVVAVLWAVLGVAAVYAVTFAAMVLTSNGWIEWQAIVIPAVVVALSVPLLLAVTGVHTYWLHPRHLSVEQQNQAVALGYYAAAPLVFLPVAALIAGGGSVAAGIGAQLYGVGAEVVAMVLVLVSWAPLLAVPVALLRVMLVMGRYAARRETLGLTVMGVSLPMLWLALAAITLLLIPALVGYVWLMLYTLLT